MNTLRQAVGEYLDVRRNLGFKLRETGKGLLEFVTFMAADKLGSHHLIDYLECAGIDRHNHRIGHVQRVLAVQEGVETLLFTPCLPIDTLRD